MVHAELVWVDSHALEEISMGTVAPRTAIVGRVLHFVEADGELIALFLPLARSL